MNPRQRTSDTPRHLAPEGDLTLTRRILSTASQTGSTQDLRLLLSDALALTEKLDSVSSSAGKGSGRSSRDYHRLSSTSAYNPKSPGAYSETGSVFRSRSIENHLDSARDSAYEHYETSASLAATIATPVRKNIRPTVQNGHRSPPRNGTPNGTPIRRVSTPLLKDKRTSNPDYAIPKSVSPSRSVSQRSTLAGEDSPLRSESRGDNVDQGLDCIAQLEALEKELQGYSSATYPKRNSKDYSLDGSQESSEESHYEVDPHYVMSS